MAPKFALFTKGSKLPLNKGSKICLSYYSLALNPQYVFMEIMEKWASSEKVPLNMLKFIDLDQRIF